MPPNELMTFRYQDWAAFAPDLDQRVDYPGCIASDELRVKLRAFYVWADARRRWWDQYGWPTDGVDYYQDLVRQKLALLG